MAGALPRLASLILASGRLLHGFVLYFHYEIVVCAAGKPAAVAPSSTREIVAHNNHGVALNGSHVIVDRQKNSVRPAAMAPGLDG